ncbi:T9SS sorting signal type C domain-containing protein [Flavobacterium anhuiense]|uniref:T9SS sorting signal type C domain-containing protein n=1 Tax=Flavobacterium anhuiense TaxID=459526 RepID=UPI003D97CBEA
MKKDLPTALNFFSFSTLVTYIEKFLKSERRTKILLILMLSFFYNSSKAQISHPFTSSGTLLLPAGMDVVTVEGWGAGGAGGGAKVTPGEGRSGGSGGGGAYAKGTINTTGLSSLGVIVGATALGGAGNGVSGGASYITGFTGAFNAPGGQGGNANIATTSNPTGGNGGTGAIGNLATAPGTNGANGRVAALSLLLTSGAGGNAGGYGTISGAGRGGDAQSTLLLTDLAGTNGGISGGGGGGALSANVAQNGGNGARGLLTITYTCKTYSFNSIAADNVCSPGTSTQVRLTGTATSLPAGTYTVTYNTSRPNAVGLPATMVVTTAGFGSFTATGLNTLGNSTITVTSLKSQDCTSTFSTNNSVNITVGVQPTLTLGTIAPVCASTSSQNVTLSYTGAANSPTTYSITWGASPANNFLPVTDSPLPAGSFTIPVPANTLGGTYTGTLTVKNALGCVSPSYNFTISVNALPTITLGSAAAVCTSTSVQSTSLNYTGVTNAPTTYSIVWNASPTNNFVPVTDANLPAGSIPISIPANTAVGTYTGTLIVKNGNSCISSGNNFTISVNALPTITLGSAAAVCTSTSVQSTSLNYTGVTNAPTTYSIVWNASPTNNFTPVTDANLPAGSIPISIPANTAVGTYTGTLIVKNGNSCISAGNNFTISVNALPTITLGSAAAVCTSTSVQSTSLNYTGVTNAPTTYSIVWNASPTNNFVPVTDANLPAGSIPISIPANTAVGTYTGTLIVKNGNSCISMGNNFTISVNALPTITLGSAAAVCTSTSVQSTSLNYTGVTNAPTTYSIVWNASPTNNFLPVTDANLPAGSIPISIPANTAVGTYTGTLIVKNGNSCISAGNNFTISVNALPAITLGSAAAVCTSTSVQSTSLNYTGVTNAPTTYSIVWNASPTNNFVPVTDANLPAGSIPISIPANTAVGTYTGTLIVKNANGCISVGNNFTIAINSAPTITTSGNLSPICQNASAQIASLPYSAATGSPINYAIDWTGLDDQGTTAFSFNPAGGNINNIIVPANTAVGTYTGVMTISTSTGCSATQTVSLTINSLPTINTAGVFTSVCQSSSVQTTTLGYNSTTGSPISYEIDWIALTDQGATPFPFSSGSGSVINVNVPANTVSGTYNGIMTITNSGGCLATQNVSLTVNPISIAPTATVTQQPTCVNNTGAITVTSPASGTGYTYSIDGVDFSNTSGIFTGLSSGVYNVQVKNTTSGCESEVKAITINASVTKVWNGSADANWGNPGNWTPTGVPIATDCIDIPDVGIDPIISGTDASFFASRLTVQNNGSLIVQSTNTITVTNEVNVIGNGSLIFENNSSLVQIADVANSGNIIYRRTTPPVKRYDVTYWSSPVTREPPYTLHDLSPNTLYDKFFRYDPSSGWITIVNGAAEMVKGTGYNIRGPQSHDINLAQVYYGEFEGVPNNGTIVGPAAVAEKFVLLGNPYPSAIYADEFINDNAASLYGTLYFWTHNTSPALIPGTTTYRYSNDYAYYNLSGATTVGQMEGTGASTEGNQTPPGGYIAAGQGFFAKSLTSQSVIFTNSMRVPNFNSQFYKSAATTEIERHRIWLNFTNTEGAFKQLLIGYVTGATNSWDNSYDAITMNANPYVDFYSINEGKKLVIQGRAVPFIASDTIPLGYKSTIPTGNFTVAIDHADGDLINRDIYLQDNVTKTIHNLKTGSYTFTSDPGTFLNRFVLRYTNPNETLGNENFENQEQKILVSVKNKDIRLQSISDQQNLEEAAIYDSGGHLLYRKKQIGDKEWVVTNFQSGPQVLLVKITLESGKTVTKKIVFK